MLVTGIDPGGRVTAYGVVRITESGPQVVSSGVIRVSTKLCFAERVRKIYVVLCEVLNEHQPDVVSLENAFFGKNVRTAMMLGRVIGVVALASAEAGAEFIEYSPREIKSSVTGSGNASKSQTKFMVGRLLGMDPETLQEDEADALAAAMCHVHRCNVVRSE